jgi:hypothetical protein
MAIIKLFFKSIKRSTKLTKYFIIRHFSVTVPKRYPKGNDKAIFNKISESAMTSPKPPLPKNISTPSATVTSTSLGHKPESTKEPQEFDNTKKVPITTTKGLQVNSTKEKVLDTKKDLLNIYKDSKQALDIKKRVVVQETESFVVARINKDVMINDVYKNSSGISHELAHDILIRNAPKQLPVGFALITSAHNNKDATGEQFVKISNKKFNGDFVPATTETSKRPLDDFGYVIAPRSPTKIVDNYGNHVPNPEKGGQYVAPLKNPRSFESVDSFVVNAKNTEVIKSPEILSKIKEVSDKSKERTPIVRRHKDDPSNFTENGRSLSEEVD